MKTTTLGIFSDRIDAEAAINELRKSGISDSDISYVAINSEGDVVEQDSMGESVAKGAATGATTGAVLGGFAGLAAAAGVLPGLGALFVAGPIATALGFTSGVAATTAAGAITGAAAGGLIGALGAFGVSATDAEMYEERVRAGNILLIIHSNNLGIKDILAKYDADEIREYTSNA